MSPDTDVLSGNVTLTRGQWVRWHLFRMRHVILINTRPRGGQYISGRTRFMGPYYRWLAWIVAHVTPWRARGLVSWSVPEATLSIWVLPEPKRVPVRNSTRLWLAFSLVYAGLVWFERPAVSAVMLMLAGAAWHIDTSRPVPRSGSDGDGRSDDGPDH